MPPKNDAPKGSAADWLTDRAIRLLLARARARPYAERVARMGRLMVRLAPLLGWRRRAERQIAMVWPKMPAAEVRRLAESVADNAGRTLIENYSAGELHARLAGTPVSGPGLAALEAARAEGRPALLVTAHFANHEVPRHVLTHLGFEVGGLYRPMQNPYFNDHYVRTMDGWSGPIFAQGRRGTAGFARFLKSGGIGVLLFDVWTRGAPEIPFLGHPAPTSTAAAELARRFDAALIPMYAVRGPDGLGFSVTLDAPIATAEPLEMMRQVTAGLEARIRKNPEQWFWFHRRWKPERRKPQATRARPGG